mgnify:CR=1 FL=1
MCLSLLYEEDIFRSIVSKSQETNKNMIANGSNFSGGERKKISLLRALLKRGEILVLDEATANYDLQSIVLLPDPFEPQIAILSPLFILKETFFNISLSPHE